MSLHPSFTPIGDTNRFGLGSEPGELIVDGISFNVKDIGRASRANRADRKDINTLKEDDMADDKKTQDLETRIADLERKLDGLSRVGSGETVVDGQVLNAAEAQARAQTDAGINIADRPDIALEDAKAERAAIDAQRTADAQQAAKEETAAAEAKSAKAKK